MWGILRLCTGPSRCSIVESVSFTQKMVVKSKSFDTSALCSSMPSSSILRSSSTLPAPGPLTSSSASSLPIDFAIVAAKQPTIFQHASGFGARGSAVGVAVIRVSGPGCVKAFQKTTGKKTLPKPRLATVCALLHPITAEVLDPSSLFLFFEGPKSFTGEDVLEIHVHGNALVVQSTMRALQTLHSSSEPFRLSEPGEFTKRAFLNGKLDLTQVEGLADLLNAETEQQRVLAVRQMGGELGKQYTEWRTALMKCWAHCEAVIDFAEDEADVGEEQVLKNVVPQVKALYQSMRAHAKDYRRGELIRKGLNVTIVGPPNAGKSSLLNKLAQRAVAIVSHIPGTTRDVVEVSLNLGGFPVVLADTAGIRESVDVVEQEGIRRSHQRLSTADVKLVVFDAGEEELDSACLSLVDENTVVVFSKVDKLTSTGHEGTVHAFLDKSRKFLAQNCTKQPKLVCGLSVQTEYGIQNFLKEAGKIAGELMQSSGSDGPIMTRARHRDLMAECLTFIEQFERDRQHDLVKATEDLRQAAQCLGRIVGVIDVEDLLDVIFRDFCIGK